jgi:hypothetical protein
MAVIRRSESELHNLLARKHDPNEGWDQIWYLNSAKIHPPLRLSLEWHQGMRILLDAGANPRLAVRDAFAGGLEGAIKILLEYDCPLSLAWKHPRGQLDPKPIISIMSGARTGNIQFSTIILVIDKLCDQRRRLWELALEKLCETEIAGLGIRLGEGKILDEGASDLCQALIEKGVKVPPAIMVSRITPNSAFRAKLFSYRPDFVQALFDVGFRSMEALESPLQMLELSRTLEGQPYSDMLPLLHQSCLALNLDMVTWCLEHGCRPVVEVHGTVHFASHALAIGLARKINKHDDLAPFQDLEKSGLLSTLLSLEGKCERDQCVCYCSLNGCSTVTLLTNVLTGHTCREKRCWPRKTRILREWLRLLQMSLSILVADWEDFFRVEVFNRLGMAHTCCYSRYDFQLNPISQEELPELRDEDEKAGYVEQLSKWMDEYRKEQLAFDGPEDKFWKIWFKKLKDKDHDLYVNETHREMWEGGKCQYLKVLAEKSDALAAGEAERNPDWERDYDPDDYYGFDCWDTCRCFKGERTGETILGYDRAGRRSLSNGPAG